MPTALRKYGCRFHFYSGDGNEPPHIHVDGNGCKAKIWLNNVEIAKREGFTDSDMRRIMKTVSENRNKLLEAWHGFFN